MCCLSSHRTLGGRMATPLAGVPGMEGWGLDHLWFGEIRLTNLADIFLTGNWPKWFWNICFQDTVFKSPSRFIPSAHLQFNFSAPLHSGSRGQTLPASSCFKGQIVMGAHSGVGTLALACHLGPGCLKVRPCLELIRYFSEGQQTEPEDHSTH